VFVALRWSGAGPVPKTLVISAYWERPEAQFVRELERAIASLIGPEPPAPGRLSARTMV
jgi:hypothetical protein